jgi:hypothetical protein
MLSTRYRTGELGDHTPRGPPTTLKHFFFLFLFLVLVEAEGGARGGAWWPGVAGVWCAVGVWRPAALVAGRE